MYWYISEAEERAGITKDWLPILNWRVCGYPIMVTRKLPEEPKPYEHPFKQFL